LGGEGGWTEQSPILEASKGEELDVYTQREQRTENASSASGGEGSIMLLPAFPLSPSSPFDGGATDPPDPERPAIVVASIQLRS